MTDREERVLATFHTSDDSFQVVVTRQGMIYVRDKTGKREPTEKTYLPSWIRVQRTLWKRAD